MMEGMAEPAPMNRPLGANLRSIKHKLRPNGLLRKSLILTMLLYLSPVVGMLLEIVMIRVFTAGSVLDTFRALMTFMMMGQGVITSQLLKYALVPQLAQFRVENRDREGLHFALYFTGLVVCILSPVLVVGLVWPEQLLYFFAPGLDADLITMARGLVRVTATGFILLTIVGSMSAVMNFYGVFWGQPLGQVVSNLVILLAVYCFGAHAAFPEQQFGLLEISVGLGLVLMVLLMLWQCAKVWVHTAPASSSMNFLVQFRLSLVMLLPQLVIIAAEVIKPLAVNRTLSQIGVGSIALYLLAFRLQMIGNLPAKAMTTVLFPDLSRLKSEASSVVLMKRLAQGSWQVFILTALISVLLWFCAGLVVDLIAHFGKITVQQQNTVLALYQVFLLFSPFGALGLFYMETAFAYKQTGMVLVYSVINTALIVLVLPLAIAEGTLSVAVLYTVSQGICMMLLGIALFMKLYGLSRKEQQAG